MCYFKIAVVVATAVALTAPTLAAQDDAAALYQPLLGDWEMTMETPRGTFTQEFVFMLEGDALKGTSSSRMGTTALENVSFKDGTLSFDVERSFDERSFTQSYTATIEGDTMKGTVSGGRGDREFTATRKTT